MKFALFFLAKVLGKSSTGNTILNENVFEAAASCSSLTSQCTSRHANIFGRDILVADTPGLFDTRSSIEVVLEEIYKCIGSTSPGPDCFLHWHFHDLPMKMKKTIERFVNFFGKDVYRFMMIVFTGKQILDREKLSFEQYLEKVPGKLQTIIRKCNDRCIAFNNLANWSKRKKTS